MVKRAKKSKEIASRRQFFAKITVPTHKMDAFCFSFSSSSQVTCLSLLGVARPTDTTAHHSLLVLKRSFSFLNFA